MHVDFVLLKIQFGLNDVLFVLCGAATVSNAKKYKL